MEEDAGVIITMMMKDLTGQSFSKEDFIWMAQLATDMANELSEARAQNIILMIEVARLSGALTPEMEEEMKALIGEASADPEIASLFESLSLS